MGSLYDPFQSVIEVTSTPNPSTVTVLGKLRNIDLLQPQEEKDIINN